MNVRNHFNENVTVDVTIPPQQQDEGCQYFQVQKRKGYGLTTDDSFGKQGEYRLPAKNSGDNFGRYSDLWVNVQVAMPDTKSEVVECRPEVNASSGYSQDLVLKARPGLRFGERITNFFANLGFPDTQLELFQDVCTNTERNTMENPESVECPEDETSSPPVTWATVALAGVAVIVFLVLATWGRMVWKVLRAISPI